MRLPARHRFASGEAGGLRRSFGVAPRNDVLIHAKSKQNFKIRIAPGSYNRRLGGDRAKKKKKAGCAISRGAL